jgi:hypothetical protein
MMELFACRLNHNDKHFGKSALIVAGGQAEVLVPTVAGRIDGEVLAAAGTALKRAGGRLPPASARQCSSAAAYGRGGDWREGEHQHQDLVGGYRPPDRVIGIML